MLEQPTTIDNRLPFDPPIAPMIDLEHAPFVERIAAESAIDGLALCRIDAESGRSNLFYVSESLCRLVGISADRLLGKEVPALLSRSTSPEALNEFRASVRAGNKSEIHIDLRHIAGFSLPFRVTLQFFPQFEIFPQLETDSPCCLVLFTDLSRHPAERILHDQSKVLDALAGGQDLNVVLRQIASQVESQISGTKCWFSLGDSSGNLDPVVTGEFRRALVADVLKQISESVDLSVPKTLLVEELPLEFQPSLRDRGVYAIWLFPVVGPDGRRCGLLAVTHGDRPAPNPSEERSLRHLLRVASVGIERASTEARLAHRALHDLLTHLPNRTLVMDRLDQAVARLGRERMPLAAILVDVNRFKTLNERFGSDAGDRTLREIASRLRGAVRLGDTVGRIGGDQFLVLCVSVSGEMDATGMAQRVVEVLKDPVEIDSGELVCFSASIGVVLIDQPGQSASSIIGAAESAIASINDRGRTQFAVFEEKLQQRIAVRHEIERALRAALTENELVVHYQPVVSNVDGQMVGAEALVRWERPGYGLLAPKAFIGIAEKSGLILPLGKWVLEQVCRDISNWPERDGVVPVVTINLSASQLADESLVVDVVSALDRYGVAADRLGFEVTESMQMEDVEAVTSSLRRLGALGCRLAIDDFGIGYATLDYIRRFSMANAIKVDRSFVDGLGISREDTAIVTASVALAKALKLEVVAEGVETMQQFYELVELGCDYAQGYVLSRPIPLEEIFGLWLQGRLIEPDRRKLKSLV